MIELSKRQKIIEYQRIEDECNAVREREIGDTEEEWC